MRDQDRIPDLELEGLMRDTAQSLQKIVNSAGTLEDLSEAHHMMPAPSDLSRHANGSRREACAYMLRFLASIVAMRECGASEADVEYLLVRLHEFIVELYSDDYTDFVPLIREAEMIDAEEDRVYAEFSTTTDPGPEDYERLADRLEEQAAASEIAGIRARQFAREGRMEA